MGHAARRNPTSRDAADGKLLSRQTIIGAMDHALNAHADALRILEARIRAQDERIVHLERLHDIGTFAPPVQIPVEMVRAIIKTESALPCGCDPGEGWICMSHAKEAYENSY